MVDSTADIPSEELLHAIITEINELQPPPFDNTASMFDSFLLNHSRCDSLYFNEMLAKGPQFAALELGSGIGDEAPSGSDNRSSTTNLNRVASNEAFIEENSERSSLSINDFRAQENSTVTSRVKSQLLQLQNMNFELQKNNFVLKSQLQPQQDMIFELQKNNFVLKSQLQSQQDMIFELQKNNLVLKRQLQPQQDMIFELQKNNFVLKSQLQPQHEMISELQKNNSELRRQVKQQHEMISELRKQLNIQPLLDERLHLQQTQVVQGPTVDRTQLEHVAIDNVTTIERSQLGDFDQMEQLQENESVESPDECNERRVIITRSKSDGSRHVDQHNASVEEEQPTHSTPLYQVQEDNVDQSESSLQEKGSVRNRKGAVKRITYNMESSEMSHKNPRNPRKKISKAYSCGECNKRFGYKCNLTRHLKVHSGEKPYQCKECNSSFRQSDNLKTHQRIHTGEKPYQCKDCNSGFAQSGNLRKHQQIHYSKNSHKCNVCEKVFRFKSSLTNHLKIHYNKKST